MIALLRCCALEKYFRSAFFLVMPATSLLIVADSLKKEFQRAETDYFELKCQISKHVLVQTS